MNDEQLLQKYKDYIKKRNIIIGIIIVLLFIAFLTINAFNVLTKPEEKPLENEKELPIENKKDDTPPTLELTAITDEIIVDSDIDYKKYIKSAIDDIDGDIISKVEFSKIDTSKIGTYEIVYYVFDSSNNMSQQILNITIKDKPQEVETPKDNNNSVSNSESLNDPVKPNNNTTNPNDKPQISKPITKYFLFTDGYNMNNVVDACAKELKSSNRTGRCLPITDENGIYLGMKLELN